MNEKLTLTRVLAELKMIDKKIESAFTKQFIGVYQKKFDTVNKTHLKLDEFKKEAKENLQSLKDLIERKEKLKLALSKANSETKIKILNKELSISDCIAYKQSVLSILKIVLNNLKSQFNNITNIIEQGKVSIDSEIVKLLQENLKKDRKEDGKAWETIAQPFIEDNIPRSTDEDNTIKDYIDYLDDYVTEFDNEIDFALSEVNAKTEIEI